MGMRRYDLLPFCYMSFYVADRKFFSQDVAAGLYHSFRILRRAVAGRCGARRQLRIGYFFFMYSINVSRTFFLSHCRDPFSPKLNFKAAPLGTAHCAETRSAYCYSWLPFWCLPLGQQAVMIGSCGEPQLPDHSIVT